MFLIHNTIVSLGFFNKVSNKCHLQFLQPFAMGPLFSWSFIESMQHENISFATDEK